MPAVFGSPNPLSNPDIEWNPSTGATSNRDLPFNRNGGRNEAWGHSAGTYPSDNSHPFRDPFVNPHHHQSRSASHQRSAHPRSYSASGERRGHGHGNNMNAFTHGNGGVGFVDSHRFHNDNNDDDEDDEDEPFYPEEEFSTPGIRPDHLDSHPQAYPHHAPVHHPQYPQYPPPQPWAMYPPHYPVAPGAYQQVPYGHPPAPPHSNTSSNAAFFNTGKNIPKKKKVVHRRRSVDDLEFFPGQAGNDHRGNWGGGGNNGGDAWAGGHHGGGGGGGGGSWDNGGGGNVSVDWGAGGGDGGNGGGDWGHFAQERYGRDHNPNFQHHRKVNIDTRGDRAGQGWPNFDEDNRLDDSPIEFARPQGGIGHNTRRHVSAPNWRNPEEEDELEPGEIRITSNGNVTSGDWGATHGAGGGTTWGVDGDRAGSPGWEALSRGIADLKLNQHGNHQHHMPHRRHESSPPELVDIDSGRGNMPGWGSENAEPPYRQGFDNGGGRHVNVISNRNDPFANHLPDPPRRGADFHQYRGANTNGHFPTQEGERRGESSSDSSYTLGTPNTATWNAYEDQRRRGYADAFAGGSGSGAGFSIGGGVASQLKEKAMKLLRGAGIGSITLHPILRPPTMLRPTLLSWDVRRIPHPARVGIPVGEAMAAFSEPASKPGLQYMHLFVPIPGLQAAFWHFDVYPNTEELHRNTFTFGGSPTSFGKPKSQRKKDSYSAAFGEYGNNFNSSYDEYAVIRCSDILSGLSRMLHRSASSNDYHALPKIRQQQVYNAFIRRCGELEDPPSGRVRIAHSDQNKNSPEMNENYQRTYNNGLKRIDFLCGKTRWEGLESNGIDAWTVKLGKAVLK